MTRIEHLKLSKEHMAKAKAALKEFIESKGQTDWEKWQEYKTESKIANRHSGIADAMMTKELRKIHPEYLR